MDFLKDILQQHGIAADYWATASSADRDAARDEAWDEVKSLIRSLPEAEAPASLKKIMDESVLGNKPMYLSLADIYAERGDAEAAAKAHEKAYRSILENYPDPQDLYTLGYLLLKHCGVDELPLCEEDFQRTWVDFGDGDTLFVGAHSYEPRVPEFPSCAETLTLAIRAFGLAWLYYQARYDREMKKSEAWGELLTLDGLRVSFVEAGDLDAVHKVCQQFFDTWLDYWERVFAGHGLVEPFVANFRETAGYLRGREAQPQAATLSPTIGRDLLRSQRLIEWQLKELLAEVHNRQLTAEEIESLSQAIAEKVEKTSSNVVEAYEEDLAAEFGEMWLQLPVEVRHLLSQAECLRSIVHQVGQFDWSPVVLQYIRATETLLRRFGEKLDALNLRELQKDVNKGYPFATARIETFRNLFQKPKFVQLAPALGIPHGSVMAELGCQLDAIVRNYRTPYFHGAEQAYALKVKELRKLLLGAEDQGDGLLWMINSLCASD